jgi:hypothetical protein
MTLCRFDWSDVQVYDIRNVNVTAGINRQTLWSIQEFVDCRSAITRIHWGA